MKLNQIIGGITFGTDRSARLALDFSRDFVSLFEHQPNGTWTCIGSAALSAPDFSKQIDGLRIEALMRDKHRSPVTLWLPEEQILCRRYDLMDRHGVAAKAEALRHLAADSEYEAEELAVSVARAEDGEPVTILAALRQTVIEATQYARRWGFVPGTVSTRAFADEVAGLEPEFLLHETISARAGRIARGTAMATGALLAVSIGGLGAYYLASPVLLQPSTVNSTTALSAPADLADDTQQASYAPLGPTWIGHAQRLGFQTFAASDQNDAIGARQQVYAPGAVAVVLPGLTPPSTQTEMHLGAVAAAPERVRPGRLVGEVTSPRRVRVAQVQRNLRREIELIPVSVPAAEDVAPAEDKTAIAAAIDTATDGAEEIVAIAPEHTPVETVEDPVDTATESAGEDAASEYAPEQVATIPAARPASIVEETGGTSEPAAEVAAQSEPSDIDTPARDAVADADVTTRLGRSNPESANTVIAAAPALSAVPVPGQRLQAPTSALDGSVLAALSAPRPLIRPRNLITIKPKVAAKATGQGRTTNGRTLKNHPLAPRTVRVAANQQGLELGQASLIGVIEAQNGRKALVRMPTGDYRKVERGDVLDGWRVGVVGRETLRLTRRGQNRTLILVTR